MGEEGSFSKHSSAAAVMAAIGWIEIVCHFRTIDRFPRPCEHCCPFNKGRMVNQYRERYVQNGKMLQYSKTRGGRSQRE
jgi:hypothetical protein